MIGNKKEGPSVSDLTDQNESGFGRPPSLSVAVDMSSKFPPLCTATPNQI